MNMKNCGRPNVRKHREIKGSENNFTLDISLEFDSPDNMRITSSESKFKLGISGNGLINSLSFNAKTSRNKYKKSRNDIVNVSKKYLLKIIREFEKLPYDIYEKKSPKYEPSDSYFYPERQLANFMMRQLPRGNRNFCYKIDSNLVQLFYGRNRIKRVPS